MENRPITLDAVREFLLDLPKDERVRIMDEVEQQALRLRNAPLSSAWQAEIKRRLDDLHSGKAVLLDGDEVFAELERELQKE